MTKELKDKLKAYFAAKFLNWDDIDVRNEDGCDTCGYGQTEGMTLEKINAVIDEFDAEKIR